MKRRDFLKATAVGVTCVSTEAAMGALKATAKLSHAMTSDGRNTTVFLSDIHLNVDAPYALLRQHIDPLARFFAQIEVRNDISDLVLLGDIIDDWNVPAESAPNNVHDILEDPMNASVVESLQRICRQSPITVTMVTGNHDQLSFLASYQEVLTGYFPNLQIFSEEPGLGAFSLDHELWAEHGHRYTLFNAPDIWSHSGSHLPLGYFISRLAASQSVRTGQRMTFPQLLRKAMGPFVETTTLSGEKLIELVFWTVAAWAGKRPWDRFIMNGVDGWNEDPTLQDISQMYKDIYNEWSQRQNIVLPGTALVSEFRLERVASLLMSMPKRIRDFYSFRPRIVIFGHTHSAILANDFGLTKGIYANTGTWVDDHEMTWVEAQKDENGVYHVSLWRVQE